MSCYVGSNTATNTWLRLLGFIFEHGNVSRPRDMEVMEVLGMQTRFPMFAPVVEVEERKLGKRFLAAEAWWIITGQNAVEPMAPYSKQIPGFSNDGLVFDGAYGPKIVDQLRYVVDTLAEDLDSRQAVINIWRENPRPSRDIPCTLSVQFLVRHKALHVIDTMRSSDAWLGWPYDAFNFSMLATYVVIRLRSRGVNLNLGNLIMNLGSSHLYERNIEAAREVLRSTFDRNLHSTYFDSYAFKTTKDFIEWLERAKDKKLSPREPLYEVFK